MFENLSERLQGIFKNLTGKGRLSEADVDAAMREIRMALLEADVNYRVVKEFIARVRERAVGSDVLNSLTPGQQVIKIVLDELTHLLGDTNSGLVLSGRIPNVIMLVGLQGSGKTTASAKLAFRLRKQGRSPLLVACDIYRPAAIDQLEALGRELDIPVFRGEGADVARIAKAGIRHAVDNLRDVVIIDTAGRLHVDEEMMSEAVRIRTTVKPDQILMVVDAMTGQDAVNVATAFAEKVDFDGVIMSKLDGDARGGGALSIRQATGKPIKFVSLGEKPDSLEPFFPDRMAKRILGMGDVVTLIEKAQEAAEADGGIDEKALKRLQRAEFTLEDFLDQIKQVRKMGGIGGVLSSLPGAGRLKGAEQQFDERELDRVEAIIFAMTPAERRNPKIINGSRRERIAKGSGVAVSDVNRLLKQFAEARKMMRQMQSMSGKGRKRMKFPGGLPGF
ncbi:MAG: signal recognition particle protein [Coriobacteriia bacterium]|nr:signal recognition particle protein [Coriobacteriia bacterium]